MTVLLLLVLFMLLFVLFPALYLAMDDFCRFAFPEFPNMALFIFIAAFVIEALIHLSDWYEKYKENRKDGK